MKMLHFYCAYFLSFLALIYASGYEKSSCLEREKALTLLETAEDLLSKASEAFPTCKEDLNSTNSTDCESEKPLAYLEVSKKLISDVRENFPECPKPIQKDDRITPKPIEENNKITPNPIEDDKTTAKPIEENNKTTATPIEENNKITPNPIEEDDKTTPKPIEKDDKIVENDNSTDCSEILASGRNKSGVYTIWPSETNMKGKPLQVYCDMETDDGGWTVIQRRGKFSPQQDFYLDWESYKNGFGNIKQEFWLGNENIRILCKEWCEIRFDLQDAKGDKGFALYRNFRLWGSEYNLQINSYSGDAGDSMKLHNGNNFSTKDHGKSHIVVKFKSGWWHGTYYDSNLNGIYTYVNSELERVFWRPWRNTKALTSVEIKVRQKKS